MGSVDESERTGRRKRPHRAERQFAVTGLERYLWIRCYADDPEFRADLEELYNVHMPTILVLALVGDSWESVYIQNAARCATRHEASEEPLPAYVEAVETLAGDWGLDRLRDDVRSTLGYHLIHEWCRLRATVTTAGPEHFGMGYGFGGLVPEVGEVVESHRWSTTIDGITVDIVDPRRVPRVRVTIDDAWYAERETMKDARARILRDAAARLDAELERIACDYEQAGLLFMDTEAERDRTRQWLYRRVAHGELVSGLGRSERKAGRRVSDKTIINRTRELANILELGPLTDS